MIYYIIRLMNLKEIRVRNLNLLIAKYGRAFVREKASYSPDGNGFNQLVTGSGSFGESVAKRFEKALDLDDGWMSESHYGQWCDADMDYEASGEVFDAQLKETLLTAANLNDEIAAQKALKAINEFSVIAKRLLDR